MCQCYYILKKNLVLMEVHEVPYHVVLVLHIARDTACLVLAQTFCNAHEGLVSASTHTHETNRDHI